MNEPKEEFPPSMREAVLWGAICWIATGIVVGGIAKAIYEWGSDAVGVLILCVFVVFSVAVFSRKKGENFLDNYDKDEAEH
ncbi:MAG: hypothetical protein EXS51_00290 [Candidatus Taylorbacteria bacterium]|nr:hypothetical protein [Candidatus Taylorbacteria bacterium]